jgi:hypothetical protein
MNVAYYAPVIAIIPTAIVVLLGFIISVSTQDAQPEEFDED